MTWLVYSAPARFREGHPRWHAISGSKYVCYKCGTKFYDLKKPVPACPKCGADQREAPVAKPLSARAARAAAAAPKEVEEPELPATDDEEAEDDEEDEKDED